ncbi:MAG TPA: hypothetical protein VFT16_02610 [Candidatus Saccharimonadales bacterium]|nr:hypothetical protein [Candidatus Saccharimonadales bacterium]
MTPETSYGNSLGLPEPFYTTIRPYVDQTLAIDERQIAATPDQLMRIWREAVSARRVHPELQEIIAEWATSAAASSPLVNDNDLFEDIQARFGRLEVPNDANQSDWAELENLIESAGF